MKCYAFDVDETMEVSNGPVKLQSIADLRNEGHTVGICGNWALALQACPQLRHVVSFVGQMLMPKHLFLAQISTFWPHEEYVMVGNDPSKYGNSNDIEAARLAGWRFIREKDFAEGVR